MDIIRRITVFAVAAIMAPATMTIGAHLSFPVNNKSFTNTGSKTVSGSSAVFSFVRENTDNEKMKILTENKTAYTSLQKYSLPTKSYSVNKNSPFDLFYFSGKSVCKTNVANLFKK